MIEIFWNQKLSYKYPDIKQLTNVSDYFSIMFNGKFLEVSENKIYIKLPEHIHINEYILDTINNIIFSWEILNEDIFQNISYELLISVLDILSYIQIKKMNKLIYFTKFWINSKIPNMTYSEFSYLWLILYQYDDKSSYENITTQYFTHLDNIENISLCIKEHFNNNYFSNCNINTIDILDKWYNYILSNYSILFTLTKEYNLNNIFLIEFSNLDELNTYTNYVEHMDIDYIQNNILFQSNTQFNLVSNEVFKNKWDFFIQHYFDSFNWNENIIFAGNFLLSLLNNDNKITYQQRNVIDIYIWGDNYTDRINTIKYLINYFYQIFNKEIYIFSKEQVLYVLTYHIQLEFRVHYTEYKSEIDIISSMITDCHEIYIKQNKLYVTTNFLKSIYTNTTTIKRKINVYELYNIFIQDLSLRILSLNNINTNYKIFDKEQLNMDIFLKLPCIIKNIYGYYYPTKLYNKRKNIYEISIHYGLYDFNIAYSDLTILDKYINSFEKDFNISINNPIKIQNYKSNTYYKSLIHLNIEELNSTTTELELQFTNLCIFKIEENQYLDKTIYLKINKYDKDNIQILSDINVVLDKIKYIIDTYPDTFHKFNESIIKMRKINQTYLLKLDISSSAIIYNSNLTNIDLNDFDDKFINTSINGKFFITDISTLSLDLCCKLKTIYI